MAIELIPKDQKPAEPKTYKIGDTFKYGKERTPYMLVSVDVCKVVLVNMLDGTRYGSPVIVSDSLHITEEEFAAVAQGNPNKFIQTDYTLTEI